MENLAGTNKKTYFIFRVAGPLAINTHDAYLEEGEHEGSRAVTYLKASKRIPILFPKEEVTSVVWGFDTLYFFNQEKCFASARVSGEDI